MFLNGFNHILAISVLYLYTPVSLFQEDDGLRKRKVTSMAASHSSSMATSAMRDEGLSTRVLAFCVLFFVIGVIIGKLAL